jgi:sulfonate transport system permease protein
VRPSLRAAADRLTPWFLPVGLVLAWEAASQLGLLSARVLPAPSDTARAFSDTLASGVLLEHVAASTQRAVIGLAVGGSLGFALGLLNGVFPVAERLLDSSLQMLRNIPHLAIIPLVILWFGIDEEAKLFLVAVGVAFPIYLNTFHGIRHVDRGWSRWPAPMGSAPGPCSRASSSPAPCRRCWSGCATPWASCG